MKTSNPNLNTVPYWEKSYAKKQKYKGHENFHYRGEIKLVGRETDTQECKECHKIFPPIAFTSASIRSDGAYYLQRACRQCRSKLEIEKREARKNAPPKPDRCDRCHQRKFLTIDHIHGTTKVRGWLCNSCNSGLGSLGDNLEGVLQSAIYLESDKNKIIETLDKVFNEMFARER